MPPSATNSSLSDLPRADQADVEIEFAEFTDDGQSEPLEASHAPTVAAPSWFKMRARSRSDATSPGEPSSATEVAAPVTSTTSSATPTDIAARPRQPQKTKRSTRTDDGIPASSNARVRRSSSPAKSQQPTTSRPTDENEKAPQPPFWDNWRQHLRRAVLGAYGTSLLFHLVTLLVLSAIVIHQHQPPEALSTTLSEADGVPEAFDGLVELSLPKAGAELSKAPLLTPIEIADPRLFAPADVIANAAQTVGKENGGSEFGDSDGFQFKMPSGGRAVKKGSFAAWTVPADPKPREDYLIIIRIKLPPGSKTYRVSDIGGEVIGTDGFMLKVPFDTRRPDATRTERNGNVVPVKPNDLLRIVDGHAQIVVNIPGAAALVKDTIQVKSKILKEEQRLEIEF